MEIGDILSDAYGRIRGLVARITEGLDVDDLAFRPDADANSIGWLLWHLTRVQDHHVSEIAGREQAWIDDGWAERFSMDADETNTGYGHTSQEVAAVRPDAATLRGYHEAVCDRTLAYLETIDAAELDRIIDHSYDPPVSVGVRLVSVIGDDLQHAGQAAYVRGLLERRA
jgi:DinB superfamily